MSRVLFTATPGYGHLHPMLSLALEFRAAGHEVVVATGPDLAPVAGRHGFPSWAVGPSMADAERRFLSRFPDSAALPPQQRLPLVLAELFVGIAGVERAEQLVPRVDRWRPDLVVHDVSEFAGPVAGARVGARVVTHGVSVLNPSAELVAAIDSQMTTLFGRWGVDGGAAQLLDSIFLDLCPPGLAPGVGNPFRDVRPLRPQLPSSLGQRLPAELDRLPFDRTVLVTLGTVVNGAPGVFETLLAGLAGLPVNLVLAVGPDIDPARLGPQPPHVYAARYLPFELLLPRCAAVVAHAGAGTLLASLAAGLPSVLVPQGAEQVGNALAAQGAGTAVAVLPDELDAAAARRAVEQVLGEPRFRRAAAGIGAQIAAMPAAERVADELAAELLPSPALAALHPLPR